ncbi:MAG: hypothetical protein WDO19_26740 [Bacteroidota bacterium]
MKMAAKKILAMSIWKGKNEAWFNALLDELGNFQDKYTSVALLKSYWIISPETFITRPC